MTSRPPRTSFAIVVVVLVAAACSPPPRHSLGSGHDHGPWSEQPPELPALPSRAHAPAPHLSTEVALRDIAGVALAAAPQRRITQKVLLLAATGTEPAFLAARLSLQRIGIPFETVIASQQDVTASMLSDGGSTCHFSSVLFATSGLAYLTAAGTWESALSAQEWADLRAFEVACSAREAILVRVAEPRFLGLAFASSFDWTTQVQARVRDASVLRRVNATASIPVRHAYGYRATILDPATTRAIVDDGAGGVLVALHRLADGRELLVSTIDHSPYLVHSLVLEYDMLSWLTRGLFIGDKRAYLTPQIDDVFLDNDMWVVGEGNTGAVQRRLTGPELQAYLAWQAELNAKLPAGSQFVSAMGFNGVGAQPDTYADASLLSAATAAGPALRWVNHTWDHENMNAMTEAEARAEVAQNCGLALSLSLPGFSCAELITPEISGLDNPHAVAGMLTAGVRYVVSDSSVTEALRPHNPGTNPSSNVGRVSPTNPALYQIPRHPTYVFYDTATPEALVDEFNFIYRTFYGRDLTYREMTDRSTDVGLWYLLQGDIDPLMFHQANLADYGGGRSVFADWVDVTISKFLALSSVPVIALTQEQIGAAMKARGALDACNASLVIHEHAGGRDLEVRTTGACTVPVSGLAAASCGTTETYAGVPVTSIAMPAGGVRVVPLGS